MVKAKSRRLRNLKTGDAFNYNGAEYIAIALYPDPFYVWCLNTHSKCIQRIDEGEIVDLIDNWDGVRRNNSFRRGKKLSLL